MSLREELADKLRQEADAPITTWDMIGWEDMADEVIRQMEWAREDFATRHDLWATPLYSKKREDTFGPLTTAPEGWKP
jgi:hypothetical protein